MANRYADLLKRLRERAPGAFPRATPQMIAEAEAELGFRCPGCFGPCTDLWATAASGQDTG